jgi:group II intron reverse transcriptase/maturase
MPVPTKLDRFTHKARAEPTTVFNSLMGLITDVEGLRASFARQDGRKAAGVDGIKKDDYAKGLEDRLNDLSNRLRRNGYRPQPSKRAYIPKGDGRHRPLGLPSFEDRLVQERVSEVLQAIWEPEFEECSYGFRPHRSPHDALRRVEQIIGRQRTQWVVEADIKGFFDHVSHDHLMRFLQHRIQDPRLLRLIKRFLKAGVLEQGKVIRLEQGTPQGGLVSPVLANIYLHYVLDLWFAKRYRKTCRGQAHMVRYADDFIACFQHEDDAKRFLTDLIERLKAFELEVEPSKTALLRFGSQAQANCHRDDLKRPKTFTFLGLTHYVGRSRKGKFIVGRKTERKRFGKKLKALNQRLRTLRVKGGKAMMRYYRQHLTGHINYYGVSGNSDSVKRYVYHAAHYLHKWLNRRSQKRSINWERLMVILRQYPQPRIVHNLYVMPMWKTQTGSRMV